MFFKKNYFSEWKKKIIISFKILGKFIVIDLNIKFFYI